MAGKIYSYFLKAGEIGGVKARTKLSILTKITSIQAPSIPDSEEYILLFEEAMIQINKEFSASSTMYTGALDRIPRTTVAQEDATHHL